MMSDNITVSVQLAGDQAVAQSFDTSDATAPPPLSDMSEDDTSSNDGAHSPPPMENGDGDTMSAGSGQADGAAIAPPGHNDGADSDDYDEDDMGDAADDDGPPPMDD